MRALGYALVLVIAACVKDRRVHSPPTSPSHPGQPAASYDIRIGPTTAPHAHVTVWCRGTTEVDGRTFVDVAVELRNTGYRVVALDTEELRLDAFGPKGGRTPPARLARVTPPGTSVDVQPDDARTIDLRFEMPIGVDENDLARIRLQWAITYPDGQRYAQVTEFQQVLDALAGTIMYFDPVWTYYDPFLYGAPFYGYHAHYGVPTGRVTRQ